MPRNVFPFDIAATLGSAELTDDLNQREEDEHR